VSIVPRTNNARKIAYMYLPAGEVKKLLNSYTINTYVKNKNTYTASNALNKIRPSFWKICIV